MLECGQTEQVADKIIELIRPFAGLSISPSIQQWIEKNPEYAGKPLEPLLVVNTGNGVRHLKMQRIG